MLRSVVLQDHKVILLYVQDGNGSDDDDDN